MALLGKLEQKIGWIAIDRLPVYVVAAQSILYLFSLVNPGVVDYLLLDPASVRFDHEYWRLLTFVFVTPTQNPLFAFFYLYLLFTFGTQLENEWGTFPFTLFYLTGILGAIAAAFLTYVPVGSFFLNTSLFLAFAALYPDFQILLFFLLPVKMRWLGWVTWAWIGYAFFQASGPFRIVILLSLANYFLFFTRKHVKDMKAAFDRQRQRHRYKDWNG